MTPIPDHEERVEEAESEGKPFTQVGYGRPPVHSRFKPGQSGNPKGRPKGSQNLRTLFNKILREKVSLREGARVRKVSKAEAVLRSLVLGAMKGDPKNVVTMFKLAEQTGQFEDATEITSIQRIIVGWASSGDSGT
jgi:Family of unknown function (DUF5681)